VAHPLELVVPEAIRKKLEPLELQAFEVTEGKIEMAGRAIKVVHYKKTRVGVVLT